MNFLGLRVIDFVSTHVWGVAALVLAVTDTLAARFAVCTVQGELLGFSKAVSGHCYFSLKDVEGHDNLIRCAMFRRCAAALDFVPRDGQRVQLQGRVTVYGPRGELQFVVESMQHAGGSGALMERFFRLKAQLELEGLFAVERKRALVAYPRRIGIITSLAGAALHDVLTSLARRAPHVEVVIYGSLVQGPEAPAALVRALQVASMRAEVDTLLLCRGGGSLEDLWAFNEESVVRAIAACKVPVVCGVGHETDVTLADFAADLRAPTPTAAAELAAPQTLHCLGLLEQHARRLRQRVSHRLSTQVQRVDHLALRWSRPLDWVHQASQRLDSLGLRLMSSSRRWQEGQGQMLQRRATRLHAAQWRFLLLQHERLQVLASRLQALDPEQVLKRGYAWLLDEQGLPVQSVQGVTLGQAVKAVLADGQIDLQVKAVLKNTAK